jgi:hypothetical protein
MAERDMTDQEQQIAHDETSSSDKQRKKRRSVNFSHRSNVKVAANIGSEGGVQIASSSQHAPIHQTDGRSD